MKVPAHKDNTKHFPELNFEEQAKSITAAINNLSSAIAHHAKHAPNYGHDTDATKKKCVKQVHRLLGRLLED